MNLKEFNKLKDFLNKYYYNISDKEYINIRQIKHFAENYSLDSIDKICDIVCNDSIKYKNTYFNLSTFNSEDSTKTDNVAYRYSISFDWDLKDFLNCSKEYLYILQRENRDTFDNHKRELLKSIYQRVNAVGGLVLHYLVDSGYGYHAYILIDKTNNIEKVQSVQKTLIKILDADKQCSDMVRVLRLPYSYNVKDSVIQCKIIKDNTNTDKFERYSIDRLYNRFCVSKCKHKEVNKDFGFQDNKSTHICIENALKNGSQEHHKNADLVNIVVHLRNKGLSIQEVQSICKDWDNKSNYNDLTEYRVNYIYNNQKTYSLDCEGCEHKLQCNKRVYSNFEFDKIYDDDGNNIGTIVIEDKHSKLCKKAKTRKYKDSKGGKMIINEFSGNELLLINVLKYNYGTLTKSRFMEELTFKRKRSKKIINSAMSEPTFIKCTKLLEQKGIIEIIKGNSRAKIDNTYILKDIKVRIENTIEVSYFANLAVIWGVITPSELKLYILMRYLHKEQQRENSNSLKGNLFQMNMSELAQHYYGSDSANNKGHISDMIEALIDAKILQLWSTEKNSNGKDYYIYRLVC